MSFRKKRSSRLDGILKRPSNDEQMIERSPSMPTLHLAVPRSPSIKASGSMDSSHHSTHSLQGILTTSSRASSMLLSSPPGIRTTDMVAAAAGKNRQKKSLGWKNIEIQEYSRICGDNPSCSSGVPLSIGWEHTEPLIVSVTDYEINRPPRRSNHEMLMSRDTRRTMLLNDWDVHPSVIASAIRANQKVKNRRRKTVNNVGTTASAMEEVAEKVRRKTLVFFGKQSVRKEALALKDAAEKAHVQRMDIYLSSQSQASSVSSFEMLGEEAKTKSMSDADDEVSVGSTPSVEAVAAVAAHHQQIDDEDGPAYSEAPSCYGSEVSPTGLAVSGYAMSHDDDEEDSVEQEAPAKQEIPATPATAATTDDERVVTRSSGSSNKSSQPSSAYTDEEDDVPLPMYTDFPAARLTGSYDVEVVDDDEVSQLTETSRVTLDAEGEDRRRRMLDEANQRYLETKQIEERILKLEEQRLEAAAKKKKGWFVIPAPRRNRSPGRQSPARSASPRLRTSAKQRTAAPQKKPIVKRTSVQQIMSGSDDEMSC